MDAKNGISTLILVIESSADSTFPSVWGPWEVMGRIREPLRAVEPPRGGGVTGTSQRRPERSISRTKLIPADKVV